MSGDYRRGDGVACVPSEGALVREAEQQGARESVLHSTSNRLELYAVCSEVSGSRESLLGVLSEIRQIPLAELEAHCYYYTGKEAVSHLFEVACGLHSLVPGEPQIQGQVAEALEAAQDGNFAGPITSALFRAALVAGQRAPSPTRINPPAASVRPDAGG